MTNYINKKKLELLSNLVWMRIGQVLAFLAVPVIMLLVWDNFFDCSVLYLCGVWMIIGCPIACLVAGFIGDAIKSYKTTQLRKIYRSANKKFANIYRAIER